MVFTEEVAKDRQAEWVPNHVIALHCPSMCVISRSGLNRILKDVGGIDVVAVALSGHGADTDPAKRRP